MVPLQRRTWLYLYGTSYAGTAKNTIAGWAVKDIEVVMASVRERGVTFEDYDFGEMYAALVTELESMDAMAVWPALLVVAASNGPGG